MLMKPLIRRYNMRNISSIILHLVIAAVALLPVCGQDLPHAEPEAVGMSGERLSRIDGVMQEFIDSSRTAGISVLILREGHIVKAATYGWVDREARQPLGPDALFRIASQTKAITSLAVMILVEEGKLRLMDPVHRWVPSFARAAVLDPDGVGEEQPVKRPINIRDLLTHSAGIPYGTQAGIRDRYEAAGLGPAAGHGWYFADKEEPVCAAIDRLGELPMLAHPGERFVYGYATDVLGCVVERVSGRTLDEFFRERIFLPLRMHDTFFFVPHSERSRLTVVYAATPDGLERAPEGPTGQGAYVDGPRVCYSGGAGLVSTVTDYARFLQMLLNGGELDGVRIVSPQTVALMTTDHLGSAYYQPGRGFGLGFEILIDPGIAAQHGSPGSYRGGGAYATASWIDPAEKLIGIIMTQTLPSGGLDVGDRFRTMMYSAIVESFQRR